MAKRYALYRVESDREVRLGIYRQRAKAEFWKDRSNIELARYEAMGADTNQTRYEIRTVA